MSLTQQQNEIQTQLSTESPASGKKYGEYLEMIDNIAQLSPRQKAQLKTLDNKTQAYLLQKLEGGISFAERSEIRSQLDKHIAEATEIVRKKRQETARVKQETHAAEQELRDQQETQEIRNLREKIDASRAEAINRVNAIQGSTTIGIFKDHLSGIDPTITDIDTSTIDEIVEGSKQGMINLINSLSNESGSHALDLKIDGDYLDYDITNINDQVTRLRYINQQIQNIGKGAEDYEMSIASILSTVVSGGWDAIDVESWALKGLGAIVALVVVWKLAKKMVWKSIKGVFWTMPGWIIKRIGGKIRSKSSGGESEKTEAKGAEKLSISEAREKKKALVEKIQADLEVMSSDEYRQVESEWKDKATQRADTHRELRALNAEIKSTTGPNILKNIEKWEQRYQDAFKDTKRLKRYLWKKRSKDTNMQAIIDEAREKMGERYAIEFAGQEYNFAPQHEEGIKEIQEKFQEIEEKRSEIKRLRQTKVTQKNITILANIDGEISHIEKEIRGIESEVKKIAENKLNIPKSGAHYKVTKANLKSLFERIGTKALKR